MDPVTLPPELERFAAEAVAAGRYRDVSAVVEAGLALLKDAEAELSTFVATLEAAQAEAERDGYLSLEEVLQDMDRILEAQAHQQA